MMKLYFIIKIKPKIEPLMSVNQMPFIPVKKLSLRKTLHGEIL